MREQISAYPEIIPGRPDLDWYRSDQTTPQPGVTYAKKHPPYVHGKIGMAQLLHRISYVELHWYESCYDHMRRLRSPRIIANTVCGTSFRIGTKAQTCELPAPQTVLCGRCHGEKPNWGRHGSHIVSRRDARLKLGCIVKGE